jgi:hypothetical protein
MANVKGKKFGLTCMFPIIRKDRTHTLELRAYLRKMDGNRYGSPLSDVPLIHMARFAIIDDLPYQGVPNNRDDLLSDYMLFVCEFDGMNVDTLVAAMRESIAEKMVEKKEIWVEEIWKHCVAYPGLESKDALTAYFERCQLETNLFLADRPDDGVAHILRALVCKREFTNFLKDYQQKYQALSVDAQKAEFEKMWKRLEGLPTPHAGSL